MMCVPTAYGVMIGFALFLICIMLIGLAVADYMGLKDD